MTQTQSSYEGLQNDIRTMKTPEIEVWENQYADREYAIRLEFPEFTCICPKTGLPDFATINIEYCPTSACLELKSVKLYLVSYRNVGVFHEHWVNRILDDLVQVCHPKWMRVEGIVTPRGGIQTTVTSEYKAKSA